MKQFSANAPWLLDDVTGGDNTREIATVEQLLELEELEVSLRPSSLDDFIGQSKMISDLRVYVEAAKITGEPLGHILFSGPPGLGKTSLASLIAAEMGTEMKSPSGVALNKPDDVVALISYMEDRDVLFIDEVHSLPKKVQETLYTAAEDYYCDLVVGGGATAKTIRVPLPHFTLVAATTETGRLTKPMLDRFSLKCRMELYDKLSLKRIIIRAARSMDKEITDQAAAAIARRSRGTPRVAINFLKRICSYATVLEEDTLDIEITDLLFDSAGVDREGLEEVERRYLRTLIERFQGGPVGVRNLSAVLGESIESLEEIESYPIQKGMLVKMNEGRMATTKARKHLGYTIEDTTQERSYR